MFLTAKEFSYYKKFLESLGYKCTIKSEQPRPKGRGFMPK